MGRPRKTTQQFKDDAHKVHGDKYDYSLSVYEGATIPITIICREHGPFKQLPSHHLSGRGCPKCNGGTRLTNTQFIEKSKAVWGDKTYIYDLTNYKNDYTKVIITCPIHGPFEQVPKSHLHGQQGCILCQKEAAVKSGTKGHKKRIIDTSSFIKAALERHGNTYEYFCTNYINQKIPVKIFCKHHGIFEQLPTNHLAGKGCPVCGGNKRYTTETFKQKIRSIYGDYYDLSQVNYKNGREYINVICPEHGLFSVQAQNFLQGHGCYRCGIIKRSESKTKTTEEFIQEAIEEHGNKYDYSQVKYINDLTNILIICKTHGPFLQTPHAHLVGCGCPSCKETRGEERVRVWLQNNAINYEVEKTFPDLTYQKSLRYDFYIPDLKSLIEFNGIQHYQPIDYFGGEQAYIETQIRYDLKKKYALDNGFTLIEIPYWDLDNTDEILANKLMPLLT